MYFKSKYWQATTESYTVRGPTHLFTYIIIWVSLTLISAVVSVSEVTMESEAEHAIPEHNNAYSLSARSPLRRSHHWKIR